MVPHIRLCGGRRTAKSVQKINGPFPTRLVYYITPVKTLKRNDLDLDERFLSNKTFLN